MNGFHDSNGLLRQIEAASRVMEDMRRTQEALAGSPMLEGLRRMQEDVCRMQRALTRSPMLEGFRRNAEDVRRMQEALAHSPMLEGLRRTAEDVRRMQEVLARSPMLEGLRRTAEDIRRMQEALARSPMLEGLRRTQEILHDSSLTVHRALRQTDRSTALDCRVGHTGNRPVAHVTETATAREEAQERRRRLREFRQTATNRLVRLASRRRVRRPIGSSLRGFAEFVVSKKSYEQIYDPLINDLRFEYCEALAENRRWKVRWVRVRGYGSFFAAALSHVGVSGGNLALRICRNIRASG